MHAIHDKQKEKGIDTAARLWVVLTMMHDAMKMEGIESGDRLTVNHA